MYINKEYQSLSSVEFQNIFSLCLTLPDPNEPFKLRFPEFTPQQLIHAHYCKRVQEGEQINIKLFYVLRYACKKLLSDVFSHNGEHDDENKVYQAIIDVSNNLINRFNEATEASVVS